MGGLNGMDLKEPAPIQPQTKNYSFLKESLIENRFFFHLRAGSDPATDKKRLILKGFFFEIPQTVLAHVGVLTCFL